MPRTGVFNGVYFDPDVFTEYMQEQSCLNFAIIQSGILQDDPIIQKMLGNEGNVGTAPFFNPIDNEGDALNYDGKTDNTPTELTTNKQIFMAISRMKAWKEVDFVRYLSGKSPLQNLATKLVVPYWTYQWQKDLVATIKGIMGVTEMKTHKTDLSVTSGSITDANKIDLNTPLRASQKAIGDKRRDFTLFICHSTVATRLVELNIAQNIKYTVPNAVQQIELKQIGDMIIFECDDLTVDNTKPEFPVYHSYMVGRGTFLKAEKKVSHPYDTDYDPEKLGGVSMLYTKQARVMHPNGFSIKADNIVEESPTREELANSANWELKFNHRNVAIAEIISNG
jgi:hypothetical protein